MDDEKEVQRLGDPRGSHPSRPHGPRPPPAGDAIVLALSGPITRADIQNLCERVRAALGDGRVELVACDVAAVHAPDASTLDLLARLQLTARRYGGSVRLLHARVELRKLVCLAGLSDVLPCAGSGLEAGRQAEHREPPSSIEEERDPPDPIA
jgi:ABC-type transporter Mla MlaB component